MNMNDKRTACRRASAVRCAHAGGTHRGFAHRFDGLTLEEVAAELGVTTGRVHQLRSSGLERLRAQSATVRLREFAA